MNHIDRVYNAIGHQPGAGIPKGELTMDRAFMEALLERIGGRLPAKTMSDLDLLIDSAHLLGLDVVCLQSTALNRHDARKDRAITRLSDEGFFVFWVEDGAFQRTLQRNDFLAFMRAVAGQPDAVAAEISRASQTVTDNIQEAISHGAHGIIIAEDIAYQQGTYVSPVFIQEYLSPLWKTQVAAAKRPNVPVFFHSDGNLNAILPCIVGTGFDGLQCIEPTAGMDIAAIKRAYGKDLCLMGNIDPALLAVCDRSEDVIGRKEELRRVVMDLLACDDGHGGLIMGTCSGLHAGLSAEYVDFMYQLVSDL